ncbi:hypothetical protein MARPU_12955 [Marichromatium purpuratum 984]|uniref:Class I SAM-dependent methyltransferase n=1 Tax=Marichromatium purpuratum 984 TaxID=765910 RepID=W0E4B4_MARPU|nr:50S ribosomal protein L11 methyltransferase [Marichromatium purpuratum]AHF05592.1 hypothetical protein MARPU_12955 [Marichromatium purpuratum 984]
MQSTTVRAPADIASSIQGFFESGRTIQRLTPELRVELTEHTYLPKIDVPRRDWVASVAIPSFIAYASKYGLNESDLVDFCSIGTGSGIDAIAAIELLGPAHVVVTDMHHDVVDKAVGNILANLLEPSRFQVEGHVGDLAEPLLETGQLFDLIYENLPNIPLLEGIDLEHGMNSSSYIRSREHGLPEAIRNDLLELHYSLLRQAGSILKPGGHVLCSIGARVPITSILEMPRHAGFDPELLIYTWKIQSEPEEVVGSYAVHQKHGHGPFQFYPVEILREVFADLDPAQSLDAALEIEARLQPHAIDAETAIAIVQKGVELGHTVVVVDAQHRV